MLKGLDSNSTLMIWRQLVAEREKFLISLRLAIAASIIFWAIIWSVQATFKLGYEEIEFEFGLLNLVTIVLSSFIGLSLATAMEVLVFKDLVRKWPFRTAILFKTVASLGTVFILVLSGLYRSIWDKNKKKSHFEHLYYL